MVSLRILVPGPGSTGRSHPRRGILRTVSVVTSVPVLALALVGCTAAVPMTAADDAANPRCAEISVRLPDTIDELAQRETDAQATGAWGSPAQVLLTCGVAVPGPSTLRCITIEGVDWIVDDSDPKAGVFTTYGRDPATRVVVDEGTSDSNALNALSGAVGSVPADGGCTNPVDFSTGDDAVLGG